MKHTLRSKVFGDVLPYLNEDGLIAPGTYDAVIRSIHTDVVSNYIDGMSPNRVLGNLPPLISPTEKFLPRLTRNTLAQLRSGHCAHLMSYQFKIGRADADTCPNCNAASHSILHLFDCVAQPPSLSPRDLWENPWDVATFLESSNAFNFLPCVGPPPPPRRRLRR